MRHINSVDELSLKQLECGRFALSKYEYMERVTVDDVKELVHHFIHTPTIDFDNWDMTVCCVLERSMKICIM